MKRLNNQVQHMMFVKCQPEEDWDNYRFSGRITAACLTMLESLVASKTSLSLLELDGLAETFFRDNGVDPVFKGYHGFPASVCMSVNEQLVHGIPTDRKLQEGDIITFDTGCNYKGTITDSALTCIFGKPKSNEDVDLVQSTKDCLNEAIKSVRVGLNVGSIGNTIYHTARKKGYRVIERYTGHGISRDAVHSDPPVLNKAEIEDGIRIQHGMVLAIEPLLIPAENTTVTVVDEDNWTVISSGISSHEEHSILIKNNGIEVLTKRQNEN
jgi:methionyl aminopeptidase